MVSFIANAKIDASTPHESTLLIRYPPTIVTIVELIKQELYTGHIGDGKIFLYKIDNAIS